MTLTRMGRLDEARRTHERGMEIAHEIAQETGEHFFLGLQRMGLVLLSEMSGDRDADVVAAGLQAVEAAEKYGNSQTRVIVHRALASAHEQRGQWSEAIAAARRAEALAREKQTGLDLEPEWLRVLSLAHLGRGELEKARALGEYAAERARDIGTRVFEIPCRLALVRALLASGDAGMADAVGTNLDTSFDLIDSTGAEGYRPLALVEGARLAFLLDDVSRGEQGLRATHDLFVKMGATGHAEGLRAELDALS
jgi:ATP/maltotriose-dependent transcriptional regulator MalT